jgi:hypothetical protein
MALNVSYFLCQRDIYYLYISPGVGLVNGIVGKLIYDPRQVRPIGQFVSVLLIHRPSAVFI